MSTNSKVDATYEMGHPAREEERLQKLGQLLYPSTSHLFEKARMVPGIKVLDVGSGAGDVALLLAKLVGPTGSIIGVDVYSAHSFLLYGRSLGA
jgi:tRNA A58 N-methylase Trm61